ncbi:hypothetical protein VTO42DRAFT_4175 [Malbranchea cinnamomea]
MPPFNPFLRAFFRSIIPAQCAPTQHYVLLVPTTESLLNSRDRDSNTPYIDLVSSEEFLGSHVLRISTPGPSVMKDVLAVRDKQGKAKQITTVNGRTVVLKDSFVYSNKGFKTLNQVQLLSDFLYYSSNNDSEPWLIYYISKPLIGSYDPGGIPQAVVPGYHHRPSEAPGRRYRREDGSSSSPTEIKSFSDLLARFPMIARQMQPGLDRLFSEFGKELGKPLPPPPSQSGADGHGGENTESHEPWSIHGRGSYERLPFGSSFLEADEDIMRHALETAVTAAIDLFRLVDKQQLALLGATTDLTGPLIERLIERYVAEQVHDSLMFPRLCAYHEAEDAELDIQIRRMESIDVSQVGITIEGGRKGKEELIRRLAKGVEEFRKIVDAKSPHAMLDVLLTTIKVITLAPEAFENGEATEEKGPPIPAINADVLVSLLLVVIIRSQVRHLRARLLYMQKFIFVDDVESGESGYALSTLEAVLTYLLEDSAGLRKASLRNKRLWAATKAGKVAEMKAILEPDGHSSRDEGDPDPSEEHSSKEHKNGDRPNPMHDTLISTDTALSNQPEPDETPVHPETPRLAHVFPFQNWTRDSPSYPPEIPVTPRKKVSMDVRSLSELSSVSFLSRSTTAASVASGIEGDTSIESLTKTQDPAGDSIPMMAVEARSADALKYLLTLHEYYPIESILEDTNSEGTTLLSAAVQLGSIEIVDILLDFISQAADPQDVRHYFSKGDSRGRTVAHYIFSIPSLIRRLGSSLPWKQKDKHGQTPLFALCRSYDHPEYSRMVNEALSAAQEAQGDGQPLRLEDHVDAKGNTLLHVISDPQLIYRILRECDCDPNATNDKKFTPLMVASKYGRVDLVRIFFGDPRVDLHLRESRGFTAIELAKDDDVRNRIDDLILFSNPPTSLSNDTSGRITTVVRSIFLEDASVRFIIKSGAPNPPDPSDPDRMKYTTYTVTTCRRSMSDFENLVKFLKLEHPASYVPELPQFRSPFQIYSKPSRAVVHVLQERLDRLLKALLAHPTFATHELLWEFFLVPEMQTAMIEERSHRKAAVLKEYITDDYYPVNNDDIRDIEQLMSHALDAVRTMGNATRKVIRRGHAYQHATTDFADALSICANAVSTLAPPTNALPKLYVDAFNRYAACYSATSLDSSPLLQFLTTLTSMHTTTAAMQAALSRPGELVSSLHTATRSVARLQSTVASSSLPRKFNFPGMEESRLRTLREQEEKLSELSREINWLGKEIRWNKDVVVGELAGWTAWREKMGRDAIREFAKTSLVRERERGKRLERCLRGVRESTHQLHDF